MALLTAVLSALLYGSADFLGGLASRRAPALAVAIASQAVGFLVLAAFIPLVPGAGLDRPGFLWSIAAGLSGGVGVALLYHGLAVGRVSVVAPVTAVCSIAIPVVVGLALGERPGTAPLAGVALAVVSVALISSHDEPVKPGRISRDRSVAIALAAGVAIGAFLVSLAHTGRDAGLWPLLVARAASSLALAAAARASLTPLRIPRSALVATLASGAIDMTANALYLIAVRQGPLGLVATLASLYPASTVLLARLVLGERLRPLQSVGLAAAAVAVVLITAR